MANALQYAFNSLNISRAPAFAVGIPKNKSILQEHDALIRSSDESFKLIILCTRLLIQSGEPTDIQYQERRIFFH